MLESPLRTPSRPVVRRSRRDASPAPSPAAASLDDAFFRRIVAGMRNGVLAITRDARLAVMNDEACRIFGVTPHAGHLGQPVNAVLQGHPDVLRLLASAFELHHLPNRAEMRLKASNVVIGYTLALVRDDAGTPIGAAMFFKDLTRVEQLEERERLRDRLAAVGQMAATLAHEVKNPLAGIEVMAGLLRRRVAGVPDAARVLTDIIAEAKMANAIVQEVLDFVRPIRLQMERTAIADAVQAAMPLAETKARRGRIRVDVVLPPDLPQIQADQHQLAQLVTNLLMNAYEAMDGTGRVAVTAARVGPGNGGHGRDAVLLEVADEGPGIAPDVLDKIFDPFFTTKPQGSGLGLAVVRKIVDAHDGRLDVRSARGQGTTIRVTLPVTMDEGHEGPATVATWATKATEATKGTKDTKNPGATKDTKDTKDPGATKVTKDTKDPGATKVTKDTKDPGATKVTKDPGGYEGTKDTKAPGMVAVGVGG